MSSPSKPPFRLKIPLLADVIFVSDPDQIRKIETSGVADRLHTYGTSSVPGWLRMFFSATKFHDHERDLWFLPLESASNPEYKKRRAYLEAEVDKGYSQDDVNRIAALLNANADYDSLAHEIAQIVNRRFFGQEIPLTVTKASKHTVQGFVESILPWKYLRARRSQRKVMNYCAETLESDVHPVDVGHNIGETVQTTTLALRMLKNNLERPVEEIFTSGALTPLVIRIATKRSNIDGLLRSPTAEGKTLFLLKIRKAAAKTHDILFTFGAGRRERACVFMDFFLEFMNDLRTVLREGAAAKLA